MAPLSSPAGCSSCLWLSQKVAELEGRISVLHQIKDDEDLLDSMMATSQAISAGLDGSLPQAAASAAGDEEHWPRLGAKPKAMKVYCSTLSQAEPWSVAGGRSQDGRRSARHPTIRKICVNNRFSVLEELDDATPTTPIRVSSPAINFTPAPSKNSAGQRAAPDLQNCGLASRDIPTSRRPSGQAPSQTHTLSNQPEPPQETADQTPLITEPQPHRLPPRQARRPQQTTLIVGDLIVRNIQHRSAAVHSVSGAKVSDITLQLPSLLRKHHLVERIIIHVGCNAIRNCFQFEMTTQDLQCKFNYTSSH
ncbi:uncharacterized protein LOC108440347 [Pygocentrus nattereri]|uniref:uncharacterized protein LOC108440347 n=1 Tax=Pygocentrus nattereri TaxID=42514 RepID=UPI00081471DD|nr:uncharacterized protein LOC108440347 [Pygocentrus nattereri]